MVLLPNEQHRTASMHPGMTLKLSVSVILLTAFSSRLPQVISSSPLLVLGFWKLACLVTYSLKRQQETGGRRNRLDRPGDGKKDTSDS